MKIATLDTQKINLLRDLPDMIPVFREFYENWSVRIFDREQHECRNYLSPNRRDFYKILLITKGIGVFTTGLHTYYIDEPTLLFIHPNDIISWKNLSEGEVGGHYVLFRKGFINNHPLLKHAIDKYGIFGDPQKHVLQLSTAQVEQCTGLFLRMKAEELADYVYNEDAIQAYLQLMLVDAARANSYAPHVLVSDEYKHIHTFFTLLEQQTASINADSPIQMKTAKEYAHQLSIHPNHLNALLKKHTGENVSTHIKNRLLEEAKVLLLQTEWSLQDIAYSIGFAEQPNFSLFFKKNTGITPNTFRKQHLG